MTYKIATDLAQRRARQMWLADLPQGSKWDELPIEEQRANLILAIKRLDARIQLLGRGSLERRDLGKLKCELQLRVNALGPKRKRPETVADHFVRVCKERMTKAVYTAYLNEATRRAEQASAA
jgi:hypothetical protein